jgi:hypothetical protein
LVNELDKMPLDVWDRASGRAPANQQSVRVVLIRLLERYGNGQLSL